MYDLNRCPQTEQEFTDYFYTLIGRQLDTNANDWAQVLLKRYAWKGELMSIPRGVGPGIKQAADAPFFGLTQQMGSAGNPQARIFLPTSTPDALGYYTRNIQYIKDAPGGVHGTDFLWTWWYQDGNEYAPVTGPDDGNGSIDPIPPDPEQPSEDLENRVAALESEVVRLREENKVLKAELDVLDSAAIHNGERVSISTPNEANYVEAVDGGGGELNAEASDAGTPNVMFRIWRRGE